MMGASPFFTEEHELLRRTIRQFAEKELVPRVDEWEAAGAFADWVFPRLGELGFLGLRYPEEYGGQGGDYFCGLILAEELFRCGASSVALAVAVQTEMVGPTLLRFGTEEQKQRFLIPALKGQKVGALAITEPNAGSDVAAVRTFAARDGDGWVLNGQKMFITNGCRADFVIVVARTDREKQAQGVSLFVVEKGTPGFSVGRKLDKLGMRSSDTAELVFDDCRVGPGNLLGEENRGFYHIMWELQGERLIGAAGAVAGAEYCYRLAEKYARERVQFGRPLTGFQVTRHKLADMATQIEVAKQMVYATAWKVARGEYPVKEISMAKLFAAQVICRVADEALQIHGGYGYMTEFPIERIWRDSRLMRIGAGTDEIMKEIIARQLDL